jgi:hypothetical protein
MDSDDLLLLLLLLSNARPSDTPPSGLNTSSTHAITTCSPDVSVNLFHTSTLLLLVLRTPVRCKIPEAYDQQYMAAESCNQEG